MTVQKRAPFMEDSVFFFLKIININFKTFLKVMSKHFHTLNWVCIVFLGMQLASLHLAPSVHGKNKNGLRPSPPHYHLSGSPVISLVSQGITIDVNQPGVLTIYTNFLAEDLMCKCLAIVNLTLWEKDPPQRLPKSAGEIRESGQYELP